MYAYRHKKSRGHVYTVGSAVDHSNCGVFYCGTDMQAVRPAAGFPEDNLNAIDAEFWENY